MSQTTILETKAQSPAVLLMIRGTRFVEKCAVGFVAPLQFLSQQ
jgi:hypothetical protein